MDTDKANVELVNQFVNSYQNFKKEENRCILFEMYQEEKNTFKRRQLTV